MRQHDRIKYNVVKTDKIFHLYITVPTDKYINYITDRSGLVVACLSVVRPDSGSNLTAIMTE